MSLYFFYLFSYINFQIIIYILLYLIFIKSDLAYIPREELSNQSPFVSTPAQSALAEAARCGFPKIVQVISTKNLKL